MEPRPDFDTLSEPQKLEVLRYLEATGSEDIQEAVSILWRFDMNASEALAYTYNRSEGHNQRQRRHEATPNNREQEQELIKYNSHLRDKYLERATAWYNLKTYKHIMKGVARSLSECIMPKCVTKTLFYSKFDKMYKDSSKIALFSRGFDEAFRRATFEEKCCAAIVSPGERCSQILDVLNCSSETANILSTRVITFGVMSSSQEHNRLKSELEAPMVIFAYKTLFDEVKVLTWCDSSDVTESRVREAIQLYRNEKRRQKNIVIRFNNRIMSMYNHGDNLMEEEIPDRNNYQSERLLLQHQKAEYEEAEKIAEIRQKERKDSIDKEEQQRIRKESLVEDRRVRKLSLPDEPADGEIIHLNFRCPNGSKLMRKFNSQEKVEMLYHWVETNEEIQFEEEPERNFDLLKGYPPQSLLNNKDLLLKEVFEEQQELILIKEL